MSSLSTDRPLRADALRNRENLLAAARAAFAEADDAVALEAIARDAGVGIGTLYRHFPTREALVEAVYAAELDAVTAEAEDLLAQMAPELALRAWLDRYAEFAATKRGMIDTLRAGWASGRIATPTTRSRITGSVAALLAAGVRTGTLRDDVEPDDVTAMLLGIALSTAGTGVGEGAAPGGGASGTGSAPQTARLLDLLVDSLRPRPAH